MWGNSRSTLLKHLLSSRSYVMNLSSFFVRWEGEGGYSPWCNMSPACPCKCLVQKSWFSIWANMNQPFVVGNLAKSFFHEIPSIYLHAKEVFWCMSQTWIVLDIKLVSKLFMFYFVTIFANWQIHKFGCISTHRNLICVLI